MPASRTAQARHVWLVLICLLISLTMSEVNRPFHPESEFGLVIGFVLLPHLYGMLLAVVSRRLTFGSVLTIILICLPPALLNALGGGW